MRKKIVFAISILMMACPVFASAISLSDLELKLRFVADQLQTLQSQAGAVALSIGSSTAVSPECPSLTRAITIGDTDSGMYTEVASLQDFLIAKGEIPSNAFDKFAKGYFGNLTQTALESWQTQNGLMATGHLDDVTRAKIASSCARGDLPAPTITLTADRYSVLGGEMVVIDWGSTDATRCTMTTSSSGSATLEERIELSGTKELRPVMALDVSVSCVNDPRGENKGPQSTKTISISGQNQADASTVRSQLTSALVAIEAILKQMMSN